MSKLIDLTGQKFGRLIVVERAKNTKQGSAKWLCKCECGSTLVVAGGNLRSGDIKSCGCFKREVTAICSTTHGDGVGGRKASRLYGIWAGMKLRCYNKNRRHYSNYGGRGIRVCDEWKNDFGAFRNWAMSHGYADNLSIDRKKVNGNYSPDNCRWATNKQQSNNRRSNVLYSLNGESKTRTEWADIYGIDDALVRQRVDRDGMNLEDALTRPVRRCTHG